jgi:hypothetical protein
MSEPIGALAEQLVASIALAAMLSGASDACATAQPGELRHVARRASYLQRGGIGRLELIRKFDARGRDKCM